MHGFTVDPTNLWIHHALSTACSDLRVAYRDPAPVIHIMRALWPKKPTWVNEPPQRQFDFFGLWVAAMAAQPSNLWRTWSPDLSGMFECARNPLSNFFHTPRSHWKCARTIAQHTKCFRPQWRLTRNNKRLSDATTSHLGITQEELSCKNGSSRTAITHSTCKGAPAWIQTMRTQLLVDPNSLRPLWQKSGINSLTSCTTTEKCPR